METIFDGILSGSGAPTPLLLDAIRFAETGHLSPEKAATARSHRGAIGPYQLLESNLHQMGYGVRPNITVQEAFDPLTSRQIARDYISGVRRYAGLDTLADTLVAYNWGPTNAKRWAAQGRDFSKLPLETQKYLRRASDYIYKNQNEKRPSMDYVPIQAFTPIPDPDMDYIASLRMSPRDRQDRNRENSMRDAMVQQANPSAPSYASPGYYPGGMGYVPIEAYTPISDPDMAYIESLRMSPRDRQDRGRESSLQHNMITQAIEEQSPNKAQALINAFMPNQIGITPPGALSTPETTPAPQATPGTSSTPSPGALTSNNRYKSPMSMTAQPASFDPKIGMNEMLIRMGAAGLAQEGLPANRMLAAAAQEYGNIQDLNRSNALAAYQASMKAPTNTAASKDAGIDSETQERIDQIDQTLFDMNRGLEILREGGVTGLWDSTVGSLIDSAMGDPKAAGRLLLKKLKVDDALLRVAQTKGSISNAEMKMFLDPAPKDWQDESVWANWINERINALRTIRNRLATGEKVPESDRATKQQVNEFGSSIGTSFTLSNGVTVKKVD